MRITYRSKDSKEYWTDRWDAIEADLPMTNINKYPLKYALEVATNKEESILEAGCGAGRILRYFHDNGFAIRGIDYIEVAIEKLKKADPSLDVDVGDITDLKFKDESFHHVLAFGLYHNLEYGMEKAIQETNRVLKVGGFVCASFRADNIQTKIQDYLASRKNKKSSNQESKCFHKINLTKKEFEELFINAGFKIKSTYPVENMPFLYKFRFFRSRTHKNFNESKGRVEGYKLSLIGSMLQSMLMKLFPSSFCNIYLIIAQKNEVPN
tara:strand:- start:204 stop:1004 length:801 start_codon:yes stop_codon:yes gene_type:complete